MSADWTGSLLPLRCSSRYVTAVRLHENALNDGGNSSIGWHWEDFATFLVKEQQKLEATEDLRNSLEETKTATKCRRHVFDRATAFQSMCAPGRRILVSTESLIPKGTKLPRVSGCLGLCLCS
jgi:hypothetical protein